jgi:hypothetical protein
LAPDTDFIFASRLITYFVEDKISSIVAPITIAMDEVDRLSGRPYQSEFSACCAIGIMSAHNLRLLGMLTWRWSPQTVLSTNRPGGSLAI